MSDLYKDVLPLPAIALPSRVLPWGWRTAITDRAAMDDERASRMLAFCHGGWPLPGDYVSLRRNQVTTESQWVAMDGRLDYYDDQMWIAADARWGVYVDAATDLCVYGLAIPRCLPDDLEVRWMSPAGALEVRGMPRVPLSERSCAMLDAYGATMLPLCDTVGPIVRVAIAARDALAGGDRLAGLRRVVAEVAPALTLALPWTEVAVVVEAVEACAFVPDDHTLWSEEVFDARRRQALAILSDRDRELTAALRVLGTFGSGSARPAAG